MSLVIVFGAAVLTGVVVYLLGPKILETETTHDRLAAAFIFFVLIVATLWGG